jgi:L-lactate dehydrogenase complex protein LldE
MIVHHYPLLFRDEEETLAMAREVAKRCYELSQFLVDEAGYEHTAGPLPDRIAYHPSCHLTRDLGIRTQPITLLKTIPEIELVTLENEEECCGFGGVFSINQPDISSAMLEKKLNAIERSGVDTVVSCDMGCLMNLQGALERRDSDINTCHIAQVLNGRAG